MNPHILFDNVATVRVLWVYVSLVMIWNVAYKAEDVTVANDNEEGVGDNHLMAQSNVIGQLTYFFC